MKSKEFYRNFFVWCKPMIKLNYFCKLVGVQQSNLSYFMRNSCNDSMIELSKLDELYNLICNSLRIDA